MPSIFPGMNPYLEHPELFPGLHHLLISEIARFLSLQLRPKYRVAVEVRMYETTDENSLLVGIPDIIVKNRQSITDSTITNIAVAAPRSEPIKVKIPMPVSIREGYLEVREVETEVLITTIEILSPTNKRTGKGRQIYEEKRAQVLASRSNLVEIDLLRKGDPMPMIGNDIQSHYRILVCRGDRRPYADLYAFNLQDIIPSFPLPLRSGDTEPIIDLQTLLNQVYDIYGYDLVVDYSQQPVPALSETDAAWADALLQEKGVR
ncbi:MULTISPECIES: DUF4058 family protein [Nostoc]|uniref:DUF4058 family protein n=1 Tax=Nostoc paludosum FACHB-159 TaxID=2692908 RepID=A0ABR8KF75_9NOSO|nr:MULTISPECIES: DUF4058 family protein [Nostoc]MBD2681862.1 DUF4058 family protein [Nostoc sp. FACHB-857]MBD2738212.1 DUF4058 family protein [Nostoc paludosum FACHB-159]